jgi:hypothetical protein
LVWSRIGTGLCPESYESYTPCRPCFCKIHFNIILPSRSCLQSRHFVLHFLQNSIRMSLSSHACHMPCPSRPSLFVRPDNIWRGVEIMKILIMQFPAASHYAPPPYDEIFSLAPCSLHIISPVCALRSASGSMFHTHKEKPNLQFCVL